MGMQRAEDAQNEHEQADRDAAFRGAVASVMARIVRGEVTAPSYRAVMREREGDIVRTIVRIAASVAVAIVLLAAGCTVMLGSASHDALPDASEPAPRG
jgi:hypothetical protein